MSFRNTLLAGALSGLMALTACARPSVDDLVDDLRGHRAHVNQETVRILKQEALAHEVQQQPTALEEEIEQTYNLDIVGLSSSKTDERLAKIAERFARWHVLHGNNSTCKRIFLLAPPSELTWYRDRAGSMSHNGDMTLYDSYVGKDLLDHEFAHGLQYADLDATRARNERLAKILQTAGDHFQNEHFDKDELHKWKDGSVIPRGYNISPYANKNGWEFGAEWYAHTASFLRGGPSNIVHLDYSLPHWEEIFDTLAKTEMPASWIAFLCHYVRDEHFREASDAARNWDIDLEDPVQLSAFVSSYDSPEQRELYFHFKNHVLFKDESFREEAFSHPEEIIYAHEIITEHRGIVQDLFMHRKRINRQFNHGGPLDLRFVLDEVLRDRENVERIVSYHTSQVGD